MPSQILHTLFGEDVIAGLYPQLQEIRGNCRGIFMLGCQGPDVFYHNRRTRPVALEYGSLLHRRAYGTFCAHLLMMSRHDLRLEVYVLGFMTHAVLDRFFHPYIVFKSVNLHPGNPGESGISHPFFERIIDVLMLWELRRQEVSLWDQQTLADTCENPPQGLKELLLHALTSTFPEKAGQDRKLGQRIDNAFADSARYYRMSDPSETGMDQLLPADRRLLSLVFPRNLPADIDFLNLQCKPWYYPYRPSDSTAMPIPDTRSLPQIYSDAVDAAVSSLLPCITLGDFPIAVVAENIGDGCLSIHDEHGRHCAPNFTSPLPLEEVLQGQMDLRNVTTNGLNK